MPKADRKFRESKKGRTAFQSRLLPSIIVDAHCFFRAPHGRRLAAGPRQGHPVLDLGKCSRIFPSRSFAVFSRAPHKGLLLYASSVLRTAGVSPPDRDKDTLSLTSENAPAFFRLTASLYFQGPHKGLLLYASSVLRTAGVSPPDRDKDTLSLTSENAPAFSVSQLR